jgi:hypothetical protein
MIANKQERFLLPVLPVLFILIVAGLPWLRARIGPAYRGMWWYFGIVNTVLLVVLTFSPVKKDRVAPLLYVYRRHDATGVLVAQYNQTFTVPQYYLGRDCAAEAAARHVPVGGCRPPITVVTDRDSVDVPNIPINYVILYSDTPDADQAALAGALNKRLTLVKLIAPSLADRLAHAINPRHNKAGTAAIYTTS